MTGWPGNRAWGKIEPRDEEARQHHIEWHPLSAHCADVAATCEALLRAPTMRQRFARLCGRDELDEQSIQRLTALAFLHDIGKANRGFQNKQYSRAERRERGLDSAGHISVVSQLFQNDKLAEKLIRALPILERMETDWGDADSEEASIVYYLLCATISHHGSPIDVREAPASSSLKLWDADGDYDPFAVISGLGSLCQLWFAAAFETGGMPLPNRAEFQHAYAGLLMLADWIGSDTRFFPFACDNAVEAERLDWAREKAAYALEAIGLAVEKRRKHTSALSRTFGDLFHGKETPFKPNPVQKAIQGVDGQGLVVLEAETGSGKTEAALWHFKRLFEKRIVDGLYFALPTRVAATQLFDRVRAMSNQLFAEEDRPAVVLAVPGYYTADEQQGKMLPEFKVQWDDKPSDETAHRRWAAEQPKRFLAAQIAVGTIDQALCSILQLRHAHLRAVSLLRHLLVVDEVHASDAYMTTLLEQLLKLHVEKAGGSALLMSATLGGATRQRLLNCGYRRDIALPTVEQAAAITYPAISWLQADREHNSLIERPDSDRPAHAKKIYIEFLPALNAPDMIAQRAWEAAKSGAACLVIRNTVGGAIQVQKAIEALAGDGPGGDRRLLFHCHDVATLHHGRFARADRRLLDTAIGNRMGKSRSAGGIVVVGTQTLEQSLDIDADLLISDLCPMDVLLQRIGRLHRHQRQDRPAEYRNARCIVIVPEQRDLALFLPSKGGEVVRNKHGLGSVYPDLRIIETTWQLLTHRAELNIPADNRELVERATHPDVLQKCGSDSERHADWERHGQQIEGELLHSRMHAQGLTVDWGSNFGEQRFPNRLSEKVSTRLGSYDRLTHFDRCDPPAQSPFEGTIRQLTIPEFMLPRELELPDTIAPEQVEPRDGGGFSFTIGTRRFIYDRLGLRVSTE